MACVRALNELDAWREVSPAIGQGGGVEGRRGWLYSAEAEGALVSACGDSWADVEPRGGVWWCVSCNSRKLKDNRAEVTPSRPLLSRLLLLAPLRTPRPDNAHPVSFILVFHVTAKRSWLPTRRKRGADGWTRCSAWRWNDERDEGEREGRKKIGRGRGLVF